MELLNGTSTHSAKDSAKGKGQNDDTGDLLFFLWKKRDVSVEYKIY